MNSGWTTGARVDCDPGGGVLFLPRGLSINLSPRSWVADSPAPHGTIRIAQPVTSIRTPPFEDARHAWVRQGKASRDGRDSGGERSPAAVDRPGSRFLNTIQQECVIHLLWKSSQKV